MAERLEFDGAVAVVTGAGGGLGRAYATLLASRGARVVVNDAGTAVDGLGGGGPLAAEVGREIADAGGQAVPDTSDVSTPEGCAGLVAHAEEAFGPVDVLVHNAGISRRVAMADLTGAALTDVLDVHLLGSFYLVHAVWASMLARRSGRIVLTSSGGGFSGGPRNAAYAAAKMGVVGLVRCLAVEGKDYGVKANVIVPIARTRMGGTLPGRVRERLDPELVAPVVAWLCHPSCTVNGEVFSAAGGRFNRMETFVTQGFEEADLSPEAVRDHFDAVRDLDGAVPFTGPDALALRLPEGLW